MRAGQQWLACLVRFRKCQTDKWWLSRFKAEHMQCSTQVNTSPWIMYFPWEVVHSLALLSHLSGINLSKQALGRIYLYKTQKQGGLSSLGDWYSRTPQSSPFSFFCELQRLLLLVINSGFNYTRNISVLLFLRCTESITTRIHNHQNCLSQA